MGRKTVLQNYFVCFDIETTTIISGIDSKDNLIHDAFIYSGQFYDGNKYTQVRTYDEIISVLNSISDETPYGYKTAIFVHNLSYEFQFIKDGFTWVSILATENRKILSAETDKLVFRCSYLLSNMSLSKFMENENVPAEYQKTEMDYTEIRYPWTEINDSDYIYMRNDVVGLYLAIQHRIADTYNANINNLPLTSTGYVRNDCRKAMAKNKNNRKRFLETRLNIHQYELLELMFRGGNTHASRFYTGKIVDNVASFDKASSYPFEICTKKYPTKFYKSKRLDDKEFRYFLKKDYALIIHCVLADVSIKENVSVPYISSSKCINILPYTDYELWRDNGRILFAERLEMVINELDFRIIEKQYDFKFGIIELQYSVKKPLSQELIDVTLEYFNAKTSLKGIADKEYEYMKSKNKINSIYGMTVTKPIRRERYFDIETQQLKLDTESSDSDLLDAFYKNYNSFLSYQIGVWVTSYARYDLQELIDIVGSDFVYCDTDSVKFVNSEKYINIIASINERIEQESLKVSAYAYDKHNIRRVMGIWENEGISRYFKTFGAKKYLYGDDNSFKITIAGVPKKKGSDRIKESVAIGELTSWKDIDIGYVFKNVKLTSEYHDYKKSKNIAIDDEHNLQIHSNIGLYPADYTLGYARDYEQLLLFINGKVKGETC